MFNKHKLILIAIIILINLALFSQPIFAALNYQDATTLTEKGADTAGISKASDPVALASSIISALLTLVGVLFFILFLYGGVIWMTAAGNDEKVGQARKIISSAIIGLAIVSLAYVISFFIIQALEAPGV